MQEPALNSEASYASDIQYATVTSDSLYQEPQGSDGPSPRKIASCHLYSRPYEIPSQHRPQANPQKPPLLIHIYWLPFVAACSHLADSLRSSRSSRLQTAERTAPFLLGTLGKPTAFIEGGFVVTSRGIEQTPEGLTPPFYASSGPSVLQFGVVLQVSQEHLA
eukprot:2041011-Rhodomonas_salina.2